MALMNYKGKQSEQAAAESPKTGTSLSLQELGKT
jgi:hypothetical protein